MLAEREVPEVEKGTVRGLNQDTRISEKKWRELLCSQILGEQRQPLSTHPG